MRIEPKILYFGTPVVLLTTENDDGTFNLAPISSAWALGRTLVLGVGGDGQTAHNLLRRPDVVVSLPTPDLWRSMEALGRLTGRDPVPDTKPPATRFASDKFADGGLRAQPSDVVRPPRVAECPLQFETRVERTTYNEVEDFFIVETRVVAVHADPRIVVPDTDHIDPSRWRPLIYNFRHYYGLGEEELGFSYRSETPSRQEQSTNE